MTQAVRASLRATGQIGMLAAAANVTVTAAVMLIEHIRVFGGAPPDQGRGLFLAFYTEAGLLVAAGVFAFWASTRLDRDPGHRRTAIIASWLGVGVGALQIAIYAIALPWPGSLLLAKVAAEMLWPIGSGVLLAISYVGAPLGLGEPGVLRARSPWIRMVAAPAVGIDIAITVLKFYAYVPEASVVAVLAAGLLYAGMRRRHPLPGAAGWAAATWPLIALVIPDHALNIAVDTYTRNEFSREGIATALAVVILLGVLGVQLANRRTRSEGHDVETCYFDAGLRP
jgi:hypothetical protein